MSIIASLGNLFARALGRTGPAVSGTSQVANLSQAPEQTRQQIDPKIWSTPSLKTIKSKDNFHEFRLANGMKVIVKQAKGTQLSAQLRFAAGSAKDPQGCEGLAHFLEHIACSNTENFGKEIFATAGLHGGSFNAHTGYGETVYKILLPHDKSDLALKLLASIMSRVRIDPQEFAKEKGIICSEIVMHGASPARKVHRRLQEILYGQGHPYTRDVLGTKASVEATRIEDLEKFYREEYVPNNATLVISGDFDLEQLKATVNKYFADLKPRPESKEKDLSLGIKPSSERKNIMRDDALVAGSYYIYALPKFNHRETLIAQLVSAALSGGLDSRLSRKLVDGEATQGKASALAVDADYDTDKFKGHYYIYAKPMEENLDQNMHKISEVIDAELQDIAANGLSSQEFERVIRRMENSEIYSDDHQHAKIGGVVGYDENGEDWAKYFLRLDDIKTITNDEIKAFVNKYLRPDNRHSLRVYGKGKELGDGFAQLAKQANPDTKGKSADEQIMDASRFKKLVELSGGLSGLQVNMQGLDKVKYPNSMQLYHKYDRDLPLCFVDVNFPGGTLLLPEKKSHVPAMLSAMLAATGTYNPHTSKTLDKQSIENLKIALGMRFGIGLSVDTGGMHLATLSKNLDASLALAAEIMNYPALLETNNPDIVKRVEEEFARQKQSTIDIIKNMQKFPAMLASEKFSQAIYPSEHFFYQRDSDAAIKRIEETTLADLRNYYRQYMHAGKAQITAVGDISRTDLERKFMPMLDAWNNSAKLNARNLDYSRLAPVAPKPMSVQVVEANDAKPESFVIMGNPMDIKVDDPDYYAAMLANSVLGGGAKSRLFESIREEHGLAYHISSMFSSLRHGCGPFTISLGCDPKNIKKAVREVMNTTNKFLQGGMSPEELELAKLELKKSFALHAFNSRASTCSTLSELQLRDKDDKFINNVDKIIDSITMEQVMTAARKFILPENFTVVATVPKGFKEKQQVASSQRYNAHYKQSGQASSVAMAA